MKKMTLKEFKAILAESETSFEVFGYEGILNIITMCFDYKSQKEPDMREFYARRSKAIYDALKARGYYDRKEM